MKRIRKMRRIMKKVVRHHIHHRLKPVYTWFWVLFISLAALFILEFQIGVMNSFLNQTEYAFNTSQQSLTKLLQHLTRSSEDELNNVRLTASSTASQTNELAKELKNRTAKIEGIIELNTNWLTEHNRQLLHLRTAVNQDKVSMVKEVLLPSVRVKMPGSVGGGTIIYSRPDRTGNYQTYVLTACHVIQQLISHDNQGREVRAEAAIDVWREDLTRLDEYQARIVAYHPTKDLALLRLKTTHPFKYTARFVPKEEIGKTLVFSRIYTVGCPLGYEPVPTNGEIAQLNREMNGEKFWLMNAPTIFGNSGGGVFLAETNRFIGVSSMIAVYNQLVSVPVTHLGLLIPPDVIYQWLDSQIFQFIYDEHFTNKQCALIRQHLARFTPVLQGVWDE